MQQFAVQPQLLSSLHLLQRVPYQSQAFQGTLELTREAQVHSVCVENNENDCNVPSSFFAQFQNSFDLLMVISDDKNFP